MRKQKLAQQFMTLLLGCQFVAPIAFAKTQAPQPQATKPMLLAQNSQLAITKPEASEALQEKRFSLSLSLTNSQNLMEASQFEKTNSFALEVAPAYKLSESSALAATTAVVVDTKDMENAAILNNTTLSLSAFKTKLTDKITVTPSVNAVLPTNQIQVRDERYRGGFGAKGALQFSQVFGSAIDITVATAVRKSLNDYDVNAAGTPLIEYSLPQELKFDYKLNSALSASLLTRYIFAKTYGGYDRQKFLADLNLNYEMNEKWGLTAGLTNQGDAFKADGVGSNIRLFSAETTEVYIGLGMSI